MKSLLQIGVSREAIAELRKAINDILAAKADDETKREALVTLREGCLVRDTTVQDCTFTVPPTKKVARR